MQLAVLLTAVLLVVPIGAYQQPDMTDLLDQLCAGILNGISQLNCTCD